jgi:hypothetical protein
VHSCKHGPWRRRRRRRRRKGGFSGQRSQRLLNLNPKPNPLDLFVFTETIEDTSR